MLESVSLPSSFSGSESSSSKVPKSELNDVSSTTELLSDFGLVRRLERDCIRGGVEKNCEDTRRGRGVLAIMDSMSGLSDLFGGCVATLCSTLMAEVLRVARMELPLEGSVWESLRTGPLSFDMVRGRPGARTEVGGLGKLLARILRSSKTSRASALRTESREAMLSARGIMKAFVDDIVRNRCWERDDKEGTWEQERNLRQLPNWLLATFGWLCSYGHTQWPVAGVKKECEAEKACRGWRMEFMPAVFNTADVKQDERGSCCLTRRRYE